MGYKFTIVKKGYNPEEVDSYVQGIETHLKSYKEKELAIKNALINAQIAADNILKAAEEESKRMKEDTMFQLEGIKNAIIDNKRVLESFQADYKRMAQKYLIDVEENDFARLNAKIDELVRNLTNDTENVGQQPAEEQRDEMSETKIYKNEEIAATSITPEDAIRELLG